MPYATSSTGQLTTLDACYITFPSGSGRFISSQGFGQKIVLNILPEISDSKSAEYALENIAGRSTPLVTYSHSSSRTISMTIHFVTCTKRDLLVNLYNLRSLESLVYPADGNQVTPYIPPPICQLKCGSLLGDDELCVVLKSYSVKFPTDVVWDAETYLPYKFDVDTTWEVVYESTDLPGQNRIVSVGN